MAAELILSTLYTHPHVLFCINIVMSIYLILLCILSVFDFFILAVFTLGLSGVLTKHVHWGIQCLCPSLHSFETHYGFATPDLMEICVVSCTPMLMLLQSLPLKILLYLLNGVEWPTV